MKVTKSGCIDDDVAAVVVDTCSGCINLYLPETRDCDVKRGCPGENGYKCYGKVVTIINNGFGAVAIHPHKGQYISNYPVYTIPSRTSATFRSLGNVWYV